MAQGGYFVSYETVRQQQKQQAKATVKQSTKQPKSIAVDLLWQSGGDVKIDRQDDSKLNRLEESNCASWHEELHSADTTYAHIFLHE